MFSLLGKEFGRNGFLRLLYEEPFTEESLRPVLSELQDALAAAGVEMSNSIKIVQAMSTPELIKRIIHATGGFARDCEFTKALLGVLLGMKDQDPRLTEWKRACDALAEKKSKDPRNTYPNTVFWDEYEGGKQLE